MWRSESRQGLNFSYSLHSYKETPNYHNNNVSKVHLCKNKDKFKGFTFIYVATLGLFWFNFTFFSCPQCCSYTLVRFRHNNHLVEHNVFGINYLVLLLVLSSNIFCVLLFHRLHFQLFQESCLAPSAENTMFPVRLFHNKSFI